MMSTHTPNYNLEKPDIEGFYDVKVPNSNMDIIDDALKNSEQKIKEHVSAITEHTYHVLDTGIANAKVVTLPISLTSYTAGLTIRFENKLLNTGAVTINVNGLGVKNVVKPDGSAITSGDLKAGGVYTISYSGALGNFILQGSGGISTPAYYGNGSDGTWDTDSTTRTWTRSPNTTTFNYTTPGDIGKVVWTWTANKPVGVSTFKVGSWISTRYGLAFNFETSLDGINWVPIAKGVGVPNSSSGSSDIDMKFIYCKYIRAVITSTGGYDGTVTLSTYSVVESWIRAFHNTHNDICVKQYTDLNLPSGHGITTLYPNHALVIMSQGNITIGGEIRMSQKGSGSNITYPLSNVFPPHPTSNIREVLGVISELRAGKGGSGGYGGGTQGSNSIRAKGGIGDQTPTTCGGFGGGGGGGGADYYVLGGNGGDGLKSVVNVENAKAVSTPKASSIYGVQGIASQGGNGAARESTSTDYSGNPYAMQGVGGAGNGAGGGGGGGAYHKAFGDGNYGGTNGGTGGSGLPSGGCVILIAKGKITINSGAKIGVDGGNGGSGGSGSSTGQPTLMG
ncbi:hypothetical protein AABM34_06665 [Lysinibacillus fusiformis]